MPREPSAAARQARGPSAAPRQTRELSAAARVHSSDWGRGGTQIFKIEKNISKRILPVMFYIAQPPPPLPSTVNYSSLTWVRGGGRDMFYLVEFLKKIF